MHNNIIKVKRVFIPMPKFGDLETYIPWDKSWIIRLGVLDIASGIPPNPFFETPGLGDDLQAIYRCSLEWPNNEPLHVGESATLLRNLRYLSYLQGKSREFVSSGSLIHRNVSDDPHVLQESLDDLMHRDGETSQWAAAALLLEYPRRVHEHIPEEEKVYVSKAAYEHWMIQHSRGALWAPRKDATIARQAHAFHNGMTLGGVFFEPGHSEDYCFARAFNLISRDQGIERWPRLANHETNRFVEMERALRLLDQGIISSSDHRVIQAMVMLATVRKLEYNVVHPESVTKTWPGFWQFMQAVAR